MNIDKIISELTLEEKASLCSGKGYWITQDFERFNVPSIQVSDGPHGLRKQDANGDNLGTGESTPAVCFPTASALAASFNKKLLNELGETLGSECSAENVAVILGPGLNIKRSPLCGRNFEYFSEDPYLTGELASSYVTGVQSKNVGTSIKHFACNNQEKRRMTISSVVDERTFREIYLSAFEKVVKNSSPWTVMCSYNKINGIYASENHYLLTEILRDEWGYDGVVVSDWGAVSDRVQGIKAGLDLEMPSSGKVSFEKIIKAVKDGSLTENDVEKCARRVLELVLKYHKNKKDGAVFNRAKDHEKAEKFAEECMVLLKNNGVLPLNKNQKIAFIGEFAQKPRYQGSGSSKINSHKVVGAVDAVKHMENISFAQGYHTDKDITDEKLLNEALQNAKEADVTVIFAGLPDSFESEGFDRTRLDMPKCQNKLIEEVCKLQKNVIVVLHNGSPVSMPWLNEVSAVLESYLCGEGVGAAQKRILFGEVCPSGKLAETFPLSLENIPSTSNFPGGEETVEYREGIYIGYRYFDKSKREVLFPFGFGLSYTKFDYSSVEISDSKKEIGKPLVVKCKIKNVGEFDGAEVVQLYIKPKNNKIFKAVKELKGFEKVFLKKNEEKQVTFELDDRSFAHYDKQRKRFVIEEGDYEILISSSSQDEKLCTEIFAQGHKEITFEKLPECYSSGNVLKVSDEDFEKLLGFKIPVSKTDKTQKITQENTLMQAYHTKWGKRIVSLVFKVTSRGSSVGSGEMMATATCETPIKRFRTITEGKVPQSVVDSLVDIINGEKTAKNIFKIVGNVPGILFKMYKK